MPLENNALFVACALIIAVLWGLSPAGRLATGLEKLGNRIKARIKARKSPLSIKVTERRNSIEGLEAVTSKVAEFHDQMATSTLKDQTPLDRVIEERWLIARATLLGMLSLYVSRSSTHGGYDGFFIAMLFSIEALVGLALFRAIFTWMGIFEALPR